MDSAGLATNKKKARRQHAHIVFIDESGYLMMPHVARTWGRRGVTPILNHRGRHREKVSAIAALSISPQRNHVGMYFKTFVNAAINQDGVIAFLRQLLRHLRGPVIIIWDNINTHRSKLVRAYLLKRRRVSVEFLPPYAPELNVVEYRWEFDKCHELANHGIERVDELHARILESNERMKQDQARLRSFIRSAPLPIRIGPAKLSRSA